PYTAQINWGDGTSGAGTAQPSGDGQHLVVSGAHVFKEEGTYAVTATVDDPGGSQSAGSVSLTVGDAALQPWGKGFSTTAGAAFSGVVGGFGDANPYAPEEDGDFSVSIDWGDGPPSAGTVEGGNGGFTVSGGHTHAQAG